MRTSIVVVIIVFFMLFGLIGATYASYRGWGVIGSETFSVRQDSSNGLPIIGRGPGSGK